MGRAKPPNESQMESHGTALDMQGDRWHPFYLPPPVDSSNRKWKEKYIWNLHSPIAECGGVIIRMCFLPLKYFDFKTV